MKIRVALGALVISIGALMMPSTAGAVPGGAMTAAGGAFAGSSGDDLLVISRDAGLLTHNRFAAGDPGFASASDFDSTVQGVQSIPLGENKIQFDLKAGDDTVRVVGQMPDPIATTLTSTDYGTGTDTLDMSNFSGVSGSDGMRLQSSPNVEHIFGTAFNDYIFPGYYNQPVPPLTISSGAGNDVIYASSGNDVIDAGSGDNEIHGNGGHDAIAVSAPFPSTRRPIDIFNGTAAFTFRGTAGDDALFVGVGDQANSIAVDPDNASGGYSFNGGIDAVNVDLMNGADSLLLDVMAPTTVEAGGGADEVIIDANGATAQVATDNGDQVLTLPAFRYFATGEPAAIRLRATESVRVLEETLVATAPGAGGGPHVRTFRADGAPFGGFMAYAPNFTGGVHIALGDLDGDGEDEVITAPGAGGGPHVRVFFADGTDTGVGFMAYDPKFAGGVNVAAVDLDGDDIDEIITTPGPGGGPHVRIWSGDGELLDEFFADGFGSTGLRAAEGSTLTEQGRVLLISAATGPTLVAGFGGNVPDFEPYPGFGGGASVASAEIDAGPPRGRNGYHDEVVTGAGAGGGPHVKVFESPLYSGSADYDVLAGFFAYDPNFRGGVDVATCNLDGRDDEIVTAPGAGGGPHVRMFTAQGAALPLNFMAYDPKFTGGVRVACGGAEVRTF